MVEVAASVALIFYGLIAVVFCLAFAVIMFEERQT